ncbi:MAG: potassium channel family protein [Chloroflexi bacterium]|nr:potassium channel family protein [Chloroflexota bacterium]
MIRGEEDKVSTTQERRTEQLERFERADEIPMLVLALVMVPVLLAPFLYDLTAEAERILLAANRLIWAAFAAELLARVYLAPRRLAYLSQYWFDVVIVVLPILRPLRLIRAMRLIMVRRGVEGSLLFALIAVAASAIVVTFAEQDAGGAIDGFDVAAWWAITTITTVGYGDTYPVTAVGRSVAAALMLVGIGLFGVLTASVAAYFVESAQEEPGTVESSLDEVLGELRRLHDRLDAAGIAEGGAATRDA